MPGLATMLVGAVVAALIGLVIHRMITDKRRNIRSGGCIGGCAGCSHASACGGARVKDN